MNKNACLLKIALSGLNSSKQNLFFNPSIGRYQKNKPVHTVGPVQGIDRNSLINKYLSNIPEFDTPHTDEQYWKAVDLYRNEVPKHTFGNQLNDTQDLLSGLYSLKFPNSTGSKDWGDWKNRINAAHRANMSGIDAIWHLIHPKNTKDQGIRILTSPDHPGEYSREQDFKTRDRIIDFAFKSGNEKLRNAIFSSMTNRIYSVIPPKKLVAPNADVMNPGSLRYISDLDVGK